MLFRSRVKEEGKNGIHMAVRAGAPARLREVPLAAAGGLTQNGLSEEEEGVR